MLQVASNCNSGKFESIGNTSDGSLEEGIEKVESPSLVLPMEDLNLCVACLEEVANVVFIPCGHSVICEYCLCMLDNQLCPCCREQVLFFNLLPVKSKAVEDYSLSMPNVEYYSCNESRQLSNNKVSEYLEKCDSRSHFDATLSPGVSKLQFIGTSEGQDFGWFCHFCQNFHSREEIEKSLMYPLESLIQQRKEHECDIVQKTLQVWVCGSSFELNERLIRVLSEMFPVDNLHVHDMKNTNRNFRLSKKGTNIINKSLLKMPRWELRNKMASTDSCPILSREKPPVNICFQCETYSPNSHFEGHFICFRNVRTWELFRYAKRRDSWYAPDLLLYCCYNDNEQSFYDILGLKRRLRDRYGFVCKELLVLLDSIELEEGTNDCALKQCKNISLQQEQTILSVDSIQKLLKEYEPNRSDMRNVSYVNLTYQSSAFRGLLKRIVRRAGSQRKQQKRNLSLIASNIATPTLTNGDRNRNVVSTPVVSNSCRCM